MICMTTHTRAHTHTDADIDIHSCAYVDTSLSILSNQSSYGATQSLWDGKFYFTL